MNRIPNHECPVCKKGIYKRACDLAKGRVWCSVQCYKASIRRPDKKCPICTKTFFPVLPKQKYCSRECVRKIPRPHYYDGIKCRNRVERRMAQLKIKFNFTHCMVEGCDYDKCFEIHRFIPGKNGGQYIIGNMFAICPNHHSEEHRKICVFTKISDSKLGITYLK